MIHHVFNSLPAVCLWLVPAFGETCSVDLAAVQARMADLEPSYGLVLSDIGCDVPDLPAHQLLCLSAQTPGDALWPMQRLDTLAWVYAYENATGIEVDLAAPPLDADFLATRDACTDADCLCAVLIDHTNGSLGGTSPYLQ